MTTPSASSLTSLILYYSKNAPATYNNQYVGIKVANDGTARSDLWVKVTDVTGGNVTLASGESGERHVGTLAANASTVVYFLFRANAKTTTNTSFNVKLYNGAPSAGGVLIDTAAAAFDTVDESQNASANKVTGGYVNPAAPTLGSEFQVVLTGLTGTMSNAADSTAVFTPAFAQGWDPTAFELTKVDLQFDFNGSGNRTFTNQLYFPVANNGTTAGQLNNSGGAYTATYTFRAVNRTTMAVKPTPVGHIKSGGIWKYTNASSLSSIAPIDPVTNSFTITAEASPTQSANGSITYILTLANTSTKTLSVDLLKDVLPSGATYQAGTSKYNGAAIGDPNTAGSNLTWSGPFTVAGGARATLSYRVQATATSVATTYSNSATGLVGSTVIDTTLDTSDSAPAVATATVDSDFAPDTVAPTVTLTAVDGASAALSDGGSTSSTAATMTFSADETSTYTCSLDGAAPTSCSSPKSYSGLSSGSHTFWVYAKDSAGNIGSTSLTWTIVNTSKPEVASFQPTVSSSKTSPLTYSLQFTKDVTPSSLTTSDLSLVTTGSPGTWSIGSITGSGSTYLVTVTSGSPGTSGTVAVKIAANGVTDASNNSLTGPTSEQTSGAVTMTNTMDVTITGASPASGSTSNATTATFSFGAPSGSYAPDQYMCQGPGEASFTECVSPITYTGISGGSKTFSVYGNAIDPGTGAVVGSPTETRTSTWTVDATAPTVSLTSPSAGALLTDNTPTLSGACTSGDGTVSIPVYSGATASGTPVQTATATCTSSAWSVDAGTLADGQYTARAEQTDAAGNTGQSSSRTFTIDATRPTAAVSANTASTSTGSATFTVTFSESVTGFASGDLIIGGTSTSPAWSVDQVTGSAASYTVTLTTASAPSVGTLTLAVGANAVTDLAGNTGPASNSAAASMDVVSTGDLVNGAVTANSGNPWSAPVTRGGPGRSLPISKTAFSEVGGGSPSNRLYRRVASWASAACGTFDSGTEIPLATTDDDTSALGDACFKYELRGTSSNSAKNSTVESNVVKVDLTDPVVGNLSVAGGDNQITNSAAPSIATGSKSDAASGLDSGAERLTRATTTFTANACGAFGAYDAASETSLSVSAAADSGLASGCYRYTHSVSDNASNVVTRQSVVKVDVNAPTGGSLAANGGNAWTNATGPSLSGSDYSDTHSGIASGGSTIRREKATLSGAGCASDWALESSAVNDAGGADNATLVQACYRYTRSATDRAGNTSDTTPAVVKIDLTNPSMGTLSVAGGDNQLTNSAAPSITRGTESDANSGINASTEKLTRAFVAYSAESCGTFGTYDPDAETVVSNSATADSGLATGCYRYTRRVGDNAGNTATTASTVRVDVTDPVVGSLAIAGGDNQLTNLAGPAIAKGSRSDSASGLRASDEKLTRASTTFAANACGTFAAYNAAGETDISLGATADSGLASGCYRYTHRVADNAGNTATTQGVVRVDVNNPANGSLTVNSGSPWTNSQKPALAGSPYTDAHSGIATGGQSIAREKATLSGASCDNDWAVDQAAVNDAGGAENDTLVQACYRYTREAIDRAGNSAGTSSTVKIDRTNPTGGSVALEGGSAWTRSQNPSVGGSAFTDANSGISSSTLMRQRATLTGQTCGTYGTATAVTLGNGEDTATLDQACYRYTRGATDVAGNTTDVNSELKIDRTNPTGGDVTANGGNATWTKDAKPQLARTSVADANSGLASDSFTRGFAAFNGSGNCTGVTYSGADAVTIDVNGRDADTGTLVEGCYRYRSTATDNVGNADTNDATVFIDRTNPTGGSIAATKTSGAWANTPRPGLSGSAFTDANSGIDTSASVTRIVRERAEYVQGGNTCSNTWVVDDAAVAVSGGQDTDTLSEACYRYTREAADNAGNATATTPDPVQLDLTGPAGGVVTINGGTDVDAVAGEPPTMNVAGFSDQLSGLRAGSETLTRRIAPWVGGASTSSRRSGSGNMRVAAEFGDYGTAQPVTLMGNEDPVAVDPGRYFYEHTVIDESGNVTTRTALVEIRPRGYVPPADPEPVTPAPSENAATPKLRLGLGLPPSVQKARVPFGGRMYVSNPGTATTIGVRVTIRPPDGVKLVKATLSGARQMALGGDTCVIEDENLLCTIASLAPGSARPINLGIVGARAGMTVVLKGYATAENVPGRTESDDIVVIGGDPCTSTEPEDRELCALNQSLRPRVSTGITVSRKRLPSGQWAMVTVRIVNRAGVTGPMRVAIPLRGFMRPAAMPPGATMKRGILYLPVRSLEQGQGEVAQVAMRMTSSLEVTKRVFARVSVPALNGIRLTSAPVTIVPASGHAVTG